MRKNLFYILLLLLILLLVFLLFFRLKKPKEIIKEKEKIEIPEKEKRVTEKSIKERIIVSRKKSEAIDYDIYIIKVNPIGELIWEKTIDNDFVDWAEFAFQTTENDIFLICRSFDVNEPNEKFHIIKTDQHGNILLQKNLDEFYDTSQKTKQGYITIGKTWTGESKEYTVYISATDFKGDYLWTKNFGSKYYEWGYFVLMVADGSYIIGEDFDYAGNIFDFSLKKNDMFGKNLWIKSYGSDGLNRCYSISQSIDEGYILAGTSLLFDGEKNIAYLLKVDDEGNKLWERIYASKGNIEVFSVATYDNLGYFFAGTTNPKNTENYDVYLLKTDINGNKLWENTYGGPGNDAAYHVFGCNDGNFILTGLKQK